MEFYEKNKDFVDSCGRFLWYIHLNHAAEKYCHAIAIQESCVIFNSIAPNHPFMYCNPILTKIK